MNNNIAAVKAATARLAAVEDTLDTASRLTVAVNTLNLGKEDNEAGPQIGNVALNLHRIINSGATQERIDTLVRTLRLIDPDPRRQLAMAANRARRDAGQPGERAVWDAFYGLVIAIEDELDDDD